MVGCDMIRFHLGRICVCHCWLWQWRIQQGTWPLANSSGRSNWRLCSKSCSNSLSRTSQLLFNPTGTGESSTLNSGPHLLPTSLRPRTIEPHLCTNAGPSQPLNYYPLRVATALQDSRHCHLIRRRRRTNTCAQTHVTETQA